MILLKTNLAYILLFKSGQYAIKIKFFTAIFLRKMQILKNKKKEKKIFWKKKGFVLFDFQRKIPATKR